MKTCNTLDRRTKHNAINSEHAATLVEYIAAVSIVFVVLAAGLTNLGLILKNSNRAPEAVELAGPCGDLLGPTDCK